MFRYHQSIIAAQALSVLALLGGCAKEEELSSICEYLVDPNECKDSIGETGEDEGLPPPPCTLSGDDYPRTIYQCTGEFTASISFNTLLGDCGQTIGDPSWCEEVHESARSPSPTSCRRSSPAATPNSQSTRTRS
ncbi:hypothetical protein [Enhygromyxa salina]|uniref:Uncharacterized protein n=1 Tax=Enhygromyxa salina TaxID=215803 RepID=A0A2S9YN93_9BACT|nr:hypothetical protein [Enhygromyxa salina]PRQ06556.1 hypothetical protein ENSA7_37090 [Enhygromyxa salina]